MAAEDGAQPAPETEEQQAERLRPAFERIHKLVTDALASAGPLTDEEKSLVTTVCITEAAAFALEIGAGMREFTNHAMISFELAARARAEARAKAFYDAIRGLGLSEEAMEAEPPKAEGSA